jgi:iturin family lipopeptide synthetase A
VLGVGFDPVFLEMWPALSCGACVHIVGAETKANPDALAQWLHDQRISNSILPTALGEVYLAHHGTSPYMRVLGMGGDVLKRSPPEGASYRLENMYGPTGASAATRTAASCCDSNRGLLHSQCLR